MNNIQPRIGAVYDLRGDGKDVIRAGWGIYYDFGYTNATILVPGPQRAGRLGHDRSASRAGRPASGMPTAPSSPLASRSRNIASQNEVNPNGPFYGTQLTPPGIRQPWTSQFSAGWSHQLTRVDGPRRRLRPHRGHATSACAGRSTRASTAAHRRYQRPRPEPGQPDDEHERRPEQVRRHQLRRPPSAAQGHLAERLVLAVEGGGPRRLRRRRADDEPGAGLDRTRTRDVQWGPAAAHRRAPQGHGERGVPAARGASTHRRSSATARRCRCTSGRATTSTPTA